MLQTLFYVHIPPVQASGLLVVYSSIKKKFCNYAIISACKWWK